MQIQVQSIHFKADQALIRFIEEKLRKLTLFHPGIQTADVYLRVDRDDERENKRVEVKLSLPGPDLHSGRRARSFEEATAEVVEALRRQLEKAQNKAA
jgi:putative sigma-54 modulation protein